MKTAFFLFFVLITLSCSRDCDCECIKYKMTRLAYVQNFTKGKIDTVRFNAYRINDYDTIIDSPFRSYLKKIYGMDSLQYTKVKDSQFLISKSTGLTCAGTNSFYKDSFYCNCKQ